MWKDERKETGVNADTEVSRDRDRREEVRGHTGTDGWMKRKEKVECERVEGK